MQKNDASKIFSFIPETSMITFTVKNLMIPEIESINNKLKENNSSYIPLFYYDKYTNQFIYLNGEVIIILNSKCQIKVFSRKKISERVNYITLEYNNKYLLYTTVDNKISVINLLDLGKIKCLENDNINY